MEAVSPPVESPPPPQRVFWNAWTDNCRDKLEEQESKEEVSMIKQEIPDTKGCFQKNNFRHVTLAIF